MSDILRYAISITFLLSAYLISSGYSSYASARLSEYTAYLKLFTHVEWALTTRAATVKAWCLGFTEPTLEKLGLLPLLREGAAVKDAYKRAEMRSRMSQRGKELLGEYFSEYGRGYLDGELKKLRTARGALEDILKTEGEELTRSVRTLRALLFALALGGVILVI